MSTKNKVWALAITAFLTFLTIVYITARGINTPPTRYYTTKLFNLDFNYDFKSEGRGNYTKQLLFIFIVTSYFGNTINRNYIRKAAYNLNKTKMVFLLGKPPIHDRHKTKDIIEEHKKFGDIIQGNFLEAYKNLTYKHIMGLQWASTCCPNAKYIVKMDDDIVFDIHKLNQIEEILNTTTTEDQDFIAGYLLQNMVPMRNKTNKWYVTEDEYKPKSYPTFISGWFYVTTPHTASRIVDLAKREKFFWIDDVYITGILARMLKVKLYDLGKYFTLHPEVLRCCMEDFKERNMDCDVIIGPSSGDRSLFWKFNEMSKLCQWKKCAKRATPSKETCIVVKSKEVSNGRPIVANYKLT